MQREQQPQVKALLGWIERFAEPTRNRLINSACRCYPTLDSPQLNHDPAQVSCLKTLLRHANGFTVIQGGNEGLWTFLVTVIGHSCGMLEPDRGQVCGMDAHEPEWFVPVEDVIYLHNLFDCSRLRECLENAWPTISEMKPRLTILNGVWFASRNLQAEIIHLALRRHLIVRDDFRFKPEELARRAAAPIHILTVIEEKENRIRVVFQRI